MSSSAVLKRSAATDGGSYNAEFENWTLSVERWTFSAE